MELPDRIKDLPQHVVDSLIDRMEQDGRIRQLRSMQQAAYARRDYVKAVQLRDTIESLKERYLKACFDKTEGEVVQLGEIIGRMSRQDASDLVVYSNAVALCCDMIEGLVMEFEQIYHKYEPGGSIIMYDSIIKLGKEAKDNMRYINEKCSWFSLIKLADASDDMASMLLSKVKKMLRDVRKRECDEVEKSKG